jgi:CheY-like chemotaxis protein
MTPGDASAPQGRTRPQVLVVDDDDDIRELVSIALSDRGFEVVGARQGAEALARIDEHMPNLILLDMRMPVMDGWEFVREFRNRYGRRVPITVMTGADDSKLRADQVGADSYIGKPFEIDHLHEVVEDTLSEQ